MLNLSWGWGHDDGNGNKKMYAAFNQLTKSGKIKAKHCEEFFYKNGLLRLNGQEYHIEIPIDLYADQNELMAWFKKITAKGQIDMFAELEPPTAKRTECDLTVLSLKNQPWEYPDCQWRAVDVCGGGAYFKGRPQLDKCGYWVSTMLDELPIYAKHRYFDTTDYNRSLQNLGAMRWT